MVLLAVVFASVGYSQTFGSQAASSTAKNVEVEFITYKDSIDDGNRIGGVKIVTDQGGSGVQCSPSSGTTDTNDGNNHGKLHLQCPGGKTNPTREYRFVSASRDGYVVSPSSPHKEGEPFTIDPRLGKTKTMQLVMKYVGKDESSQGPTIPGGGSAPPESAKTGQVDFITYADSAQDGNEIGNVRIVTDQGGSNVQCTPNYGTTDANESKNKGHLHLACPSGANGGLRTYKFLGANRDGYEIDPSSPHKPGEEFHISGDNTTTFTIVMRKVAGVSAEKASEGDKPPPQVIVNSSRPPESQKNGRVQVTTYVYDDDGTRDRIGGINVHIQSVGRDTKNSAESCDEYNKTTDSAGGSAKANPNYGQLHFTNCWTGVGGTKAYQLSFAKLPDNLFLKDFKITGPGNAKFLSGSKTALGDIQEQFNVLKNQETTLEINMITRKEASKKANVSQIITQKGPRYVANNSSSNSKKAAAALNALAGGKLSGKKIKESIEKQGGTGNDGGSEDYEPPSVPANLKAEQDESGAIKISWDASTGNPPGEKVTYDVDRSLADTASDDEDGDSTVVEEYSELSAVDKDNIKYPQTYIYEVVANDENGNSSDPASVTITTKTLTANVRGAQTRSFVSTDHNTDTTIESADKAATIVVPPDTSGDDLSCDISEGVDVPTEGLATVGDIDATYSTNCSDEEGDDVDEFDDYYEESFIDDEEDDSELYAYNGSDWVKVPTSDADKAAAADATSIFNSNNPFPIISASKTYKDGKYGFTVKSKKLYAFALVKINKPNKITIAASVIVGAILCSFITAIIFIRQRMSRNYFEFDDSDVTSME